MHAKLKKICCFSCALMIGVVLSGCGEKKEELPETQVVKAFKIEKKQAEKVPVSNGQVATQEPQKKVTTESETDKKTGVPVPVSGVNSNVALAESPVAVEEPIVVDTSHPADDEEQKKIYDPKGRINPFAPLFKPTVENVVRSNDQPQSAREARLGRLTALEKLDLSQLKLTGIMYLPAAGRSMAMVEETTGKGHVIKKGTYIGVNSGRVIEIKENVVTIEEEVENYMGDIVVRKRELKLQKPLGEG